MAQEIGLALSWARGASRKARGALVVVLLLLVFGCFGWREQGACILRPALGASRSPARLVPLQRELIDQSLGGARIEMRARAHFVCALSFSFVCLFPSRAAPLWAGRAAELAPASERAKVGRAS